jgi:hypothetical protein
MGMADLAVKAMKMKTTATTKVVWMAAQKEAWVVVQRLLLPALPRRLWPRRRVALIMQLLLPLLWALTPWEVERLRLVAPNLLQVLHRPPRPLAPLFRLPLWRSDRAWGALACPSQCKCTL